MPLLKENLKKDKIYLALIASSAIMSLIIAIWRELK